MVDNIEVDMDRVLDIGRKVQKLIMKKCRHPMEGLYVLKATLYAMRAGMKEAGIFIDNEAELDDMLTKSIDGMMKGE